MIYARPMGSIADVLKGAVGKVATVIHAPGAAPTPSQSQSPAPAPGITVLPILLIGGAALAAYFILRRPA